MEKTVPPTSLLADLNADGWIYRRVNELADSTAWVHGIARTNAKYGIVLFGALLVVAWWQARHRPDASAPVAAVIWAGAAPIVALAIAQVINKLVDRSRPYAAMHDVQVLISRTADASFPSDHSTAAAAVAVGLLLAGRALGSYRLGIVASVAAIGLAFTRLYVGAHYPGDVIAGLALGGFVAFALAGLARRLLVPITRWTATTLLAFLITGGSARPAESEAVTGGRQLSSSAHGGEGERSSARRTRWSLL
jgi:undecaprenyl-diphosphatase